MAAKAKTGGHDGPVFCGAKKKQGPGNCTQVAGWGVPGVTTGPCKLHGGATRTHKTAAEREQARQACALFGLEMADRDPAAVLMDEITRSRRAIVWFETEVALAMNAADSEAADKRLEGWTRERKHLADVTAKALHAGVERRALELMEDEARRAVAVLEAFVAAMGLDRKDQRVLEAGQVALQVLPGGR